MGSGTKQNFFLFFDAKDHELLRVVNAFLERDRHIPQDTRKFFPVALHPHGIYELAVSQEIRVAYAVVNLLDTLEAGQAQDRLNALRALYNEVLYSASSSFRYNTGRVLIQIMKSLVRAHGNPEKQLRLAHDFRQAASGRQRIIRRLLRRYYLLEMPEEWNQVSFDHHVHDANTKGRKSPTHLIMDAWIKGIRALNVVYYNYVEAAAAKELLQAAEIMGISVHIGVEFQARFHGRYVQFIWEPTGFIDYRDMLAFLAEKPMQHLMRMGREASLHHHHYIMSLLEWYNERLRHEIGREHELELPPIREEDIRSFVGKGQTSRTHLAELIARDVRRQFALRLTALQDEYRDASPERKAWLQARVDAINALTPDAIIVDWLSHNGRPGLELPRLRTDDRAVPEVMRLLPATLIDWLTSIRGSCRIVLNLNGLTVADVLELLYECDGMITHLEMYNLKNHLSGNMPEIEGISALQKAVNEGSPVALKRVIRSIIREYGHPDEPDAEQRLRLFTEILHNIPHLQGFYSNIPLGTHIGSDSTSRSDRMHGMGFIFPETLSARARATMREEDSQRHYIPLRQEVYPRITYYPKRHTTLDPTFTGILRKLPGCAHFGMDREETWLVNKRAINYAEPGNITTLGGFQRESSQYFRLEKESPVQSRRPGFAYMNSTARNVLKVAFGFALTLATFLHTQTWWVLAWFGPLIWFAITGYRNILQATLGGGGIRRTPLLRWNDYLSWSRLCDSLMFTGISVPLLELGVRRLFLEGFCGMTSISNPLFFFSVISLVNGLYISAHNLYRGLPQEAVLGNLLRSVFAIPLSMAYSYIISSVFSLAGWDMMILTQSATVISKLASDSVAAAIEGFADKAAFLRLRSWDYQAKLDQLFACCSRLEALLPEEDPLELLLQPKDPAKTQRRKIMELEKTIIINALDLMYFWMYQPRARSTLVRILPGMTPEEREIFARSQQVLTRVHEISRLFVDGLVGRDFAKPLAFYLARHEEYLADMARLTRIVPQAP